MKPVYVLIIAVLLVAPTGCMSDRTRNMVTTCRNLLEQDDQSGVKKFIRDAEEQLASLEKPHNKIVIAVRDIQDQDAMTYKPALQECLWLLKSRQP